MNVVQLVYNQGRYPGDSTTEKHILTQNEFDTVVLAAACAALNDDSNHPFYADVMEEMDFGEMDFDTYSFGDVAYNMKVVEKLARAIRLGKIFVGEHEEGVYAFCRKSQIKEASKKMLALERKITGPDEFDF